MGTNGRKGSGPPERPSWPDDRGTDLTTLPSFWPEQVTEAVLAEATQLPGLAPPPAGAAPLWERWFERALEEGVDEDLASLGRSVIQECCLQRWDEDLRAECGWFDDGEGMLELALLEPDVARTRWCQLLDDGA
jgi:hypothetical protein